MLGQQRQRWASIETTIGEVLIDSCFNAGPEWTTLGKHYNNQVNSFQCDVGSPERDL